MNHIFFKSFFKGQKKSDFDNEPVKLDLENSLLPEPIKARMYQEFERIKELFNFNEEAYGMFKRWYIDSKLSKI